MTSYSSTVISLGRSFRTTCLARRLGRISAIIGVFPTFFWVSEANATFGFDAGVVAQDFASNYVERFQIQADEGEWVRLRRVGRALPDDWASGDIGALAGFSSVEFEEELTALADLRSQGFRLVAAHLHLGGGHHWKSGVRAGTISRYRLPLDLREVYWRAFAAGFLYAGYFDVWEVENEPDIDFVPDNAHVYAAFFKTYSLGLRDGEELRRSKDKECGKVDEARPEIENIKSKILMAPMALPPGPYLEKLSRNGVWPYTDAFNYHFYGYPEDFSGVYWQFHQAVEDLLDLKKKPTPTLRHPHFLRRGLGGEDHLQMREFPVFLTEYGYGFLSPEAAETLEGRLRQRDWFGAVLPQIRELAPEGPMAFRPRPGVNDNIEFGLFARLEDSPWVGEFDAEIEEEATRERRESNLVRTPALKWMLEYARENPYEPRHWRAPVGDRSRVVIDFFAGDDVVQSKSYGGYFVVGEGDPPQALPRRETDEPGATRTTGAGQFNVYNFSPTAVRGRLVVKLSGEKYLEQAVYLPSMDRVQVPVAFYLPAERLMRHAVDVTFIPDDRKTPESVMHTNLWPFHTSMESRSIHSLFNGTGEADQNRKLLRQRSVATGEPRLQEVGEWFLTPGLEVEETSLGWRFRTTEFPAEPLRPAMAELPLPDDFSFSAGSFLEFLYRVADDSAPGLTPNFEPYFRTANGNLYSVWPRLRATHEWREYLQAQENFTMAFHGRANPPWRFSDNRPVALVFYFRPETLPFTLEIVFPQIVKLRATNS